MKRVKGGIVTSKGTLGPNTIRHIPFKHSEQVVHMSQIYINIIAQKRVNRSYKVMLRGRGG